MSAEIISVIAIYALTVALAIILGRYISKVLQSEKTFLDKLCNPLDKIIFKIASIDENREMNWREHLYTMLAINATWLVIAITVLSNMSWLPLNPDKNPSMSWDLAFNTAVSFITNTNLQHYSGETGLSYLGQIVLMLWQFLSAATGIAICGVVFRAMKEQSSEKLGNWYHYFVRSCTRILLPLAFIGAIILVVEGVPMTFEGKATITTIEGAEQQISRGPVAAFVAIKQVGTNGGGFFGTNSAHPLENPTYLTNVVEKVYILLIPISLIFAMGHILRRPKFAYMVFGVMTAGYIALLIPAIYLELQGNPALQEMGVIQQLGSMEGKEVRFGAASSAMWAINTTCTSNGSVNAMHDSMTPLTGMFTMLGMMVNCFYGGVGVGFLNFYIFLIVAVFIGGLMVGRTPELFGKKVEAREMKIATLVALLHPLLILGGTAISSYLYSTNSTEYSGWLANPGFHGFSEMLYEFTSASANNGSGFEGLGDNTIFWNISTGLVMLLARYIPIIGPVAIAGFLGAKKFTPEGEGTLRSDSFIFGILIFSVIIILTALSFFPALTVGPIAEYFTLYK